MEHPMRGDSYRINKQTIGLSSEAENRVSIFLPKDAIVILLEGSLNENRMVGVKWEGRVVMIFADDLRDRGTLIST
jgi:hypothetical protein